MKAFWNWCRTEECACYFLKERYNIILWLTEFSESALFPEIRMWPAGKWQERRHCLSSSSLQSFPPFQRDILWSNHHKVCINFEVEKCLQHHSSCNIELIVPRCAHIQHGGICICLGTRLGWSIRCFRWQCHTWHHHQKKCHNRKDSLELAPPNLLWVVLFLPLPWRCWCWWCHRTSWVWYCRGVTGRLHGTGLHNTSSNPTGSPQLGGQRYWAVTRDLLLTPLGKVLFLVSHSCYWSAIDRSNPAPAEDAWRTERVDDEAQEHATGSECQSTCKRFTRAAVCPAATPKSCACCAGGEKMDIRSARALNASCCRSGQTFLTGLLLRGQADDADLGGGLFYYFRSQISKSTDRGVAPIGGKAKWKTLLQETAESNNTKQPWERTHPLTRLCNKLLESFNIIHNNT